MEYRARDRPCRKQRGWLAF